ncbi:putative ABC transporter, permease domain protein, partial [Vibrio parahaemolyticus VPTS-2010]
MVVSLWEPRLLRQLSLQASTLGLQPVWRLLLVA